MRLSKLRVGVAGVACGVAGVGAPMPATAGTVLIKDYFLKRMRSGTRKAGLVALVAGAIGIGTYTASCAGQEDLKAEVQTYSQTSGEEVKTYGKSKIAFTSDRDGNKEIYVMSPDGTNQTNLTNNPADDTSPSWSQDGKRIAFKSDRDGNLEIYVMNTDGSNVKRLTNNSTEDDMPAWSPDGEKLAYVMKQGTGLYIHVMKADGSEPARLSDGMLPSWSPDGKRIAFNRGTIPQMYIMDSDGDNIEPLIKPPSDISKLTPQEQLAFMLPNLLPVWSPDGKRILFTRVMAGAPKDQQKGEMNYEIYTMNTEGEDQRRLTVAPGRDMGFGWSPDGKEIVFISDRDGNPEIYVMNADGSNVKRLTDDPVPGPAALAAKFASWSPFLKAAEGEKR